MSHRKKDYLDKKTRQNVNELKQILAEVSEKYVFGSKRVLKSQIRKVLQTAKQDGLIREYTVIWKKSPKNTVDGDIYLQVKKEPKFIVITMQVYPYEEPKHVKGRLEEKK